MHIYTLLGIAPTASEAEIKKAYRKLALKLHPDKNPGDVLAQDKFIELNKAYQLALKNAELVKRSHYTKKNYQSYKASSQKNTTYSTTGNAKSKQQQGEYRQESKSDYSYTYQETYSKTHQQKQKEQEFDWDATYKKYSSNAYTNEKVKSQKAKVNSQETEATKIVLEENVVDFSKVILYAIAVLVGMLVFVLTDNVIWGITSVFILSSAILISSLFQNDIDSAHN